MAIRNKKVLSKISVASVATIMLVNQTGVDVFADTEKAKPFTVTYNAGHGGKDPGAIATNGMKEHDICTDIAVGLKKALDDFSVKNATERSGATFSERIKLAKSLKSLNIEIHNNSATSTSKGFEIFVQNKNDSAFIKSLEKTGASFSKKAGFANRGIKTDKSARVGSLEMTYSSKDSYGILIEIGFLSNPEEVKKVDTLAKRKMMGYLFGVELLVGLNAISAEEGDFKIKQTAIQYGLLEGEVKITNIKTTKTKSSDKKLSLQELIEINKKYTKKLEQETVEIEERVMKRIMAFNEDSVNSTETKEIVNGTTENLGLNQVAIDSINRLNEESAKPENNINTSTNEGTDTTVDVNNSQTEIPNIKDEVSNENVQEETINNSNELSNNLTNESSSLDNEVLNNVETLNKDSLNEKAPATTETTQAVENVYDIDKLMKNIETFNKESANSDKVGAPTEESKDNSTSVEMNYAPKEEFIEEDTKDSDDEE